MTASAPAIQRKAAGPAIPASAPAIAPPGPGRPLDEDVRARLEPVLGAELGAVRVHDGGEAQATAARLGARAFTHGSHIWLGAGESASDLALMAHEATHVVQQRAGGAAPVQRALADLVPDELLGTIRGLAGQLAGHRATVASTAQAASTTGASRASSAAATADGEATARTTDEKSAAAQAARADATDAATAQGQASSVARAGQREAAAFASAEPAARAAVDPVPARSPGPGPLRLPAQEVRGAAPIACPEAALLRQVSGAGASAIDAMVDGGKKVGAGEVAAFAGRQIAHARTAGAALASQAASARHAIEEQARTRLAPVGTALAGAQAAAAQEARAAQARVKQDTAAALAAADRTLAAARSQVSASVDGAVTTAKAGASGLLARAHAVAGPLWQMVPPEIRRPIEDGERALGPAIEGARATADATLASIERVAGDTAARVGRVATAAGAAVESSFASGRRAIGRATDEVGRAAGQVAATAGAGAGRATHAIGVVTDRQIAAVSQASGPIVDRLKGKACAALGDRVGPCANQFLPDPSDGTTGFGNLVVKADMTVPWNGMLVKFAGSATCKVTRTAAVYTAVLTGEATVVGRAALDGKELPAASGGVNVAVDGTVPGRVAPNPAGEVARRLETTPDAAYAIEVAIRALGAIPGAGVPVPVVPAPDKPAAPPSADGTPAAATPTAELSMGAGAKVNASVTYTFDATKDRTSCDGLGGLLAFLASQGAGAALPAPFGTLASEGGRAAFKDRETSAEVTLAGTLDATAEARATSELGSAKVSATGEQGVTLKDALVPQRDRDGTINPRAVKRELSATLYEKVGADAAAELTPAAFKIARGTAGGSLTASLILRYLVEERSLHPGVQLQGVITAGLETMPTLVAALPPEIRDPIARARDRHAAGASEALVTLTMIASLANLEQLSAALEPELRKGRGATAAGVWAAARPYLRDARNANVEVDVKLTLSEKLLGVRGSGGVPGKGSGGGELALHRGKELALVPKTTLYLR